MRIWRAATTALVLIIGSALHAAAQDSEPVIQRAESLRQAGRPWHAAELLLWAAARDSHPGAGFVVQGAAAELAARRYERARSLLAGQPWLETYQDGEALALLAQAEDRLGLRGPAATHFTAARGHAHGARAALLAVRAGLAWEALGEADSAAHAYAAARSESLTSIDPWLRLRLARVSRDTIRAVALVAELPAPASRYVPLVRARSLLAAADTGAAVGAFAAAGRMLDVARLALAARDTVRARAALYELLARSPESDDAAAGVALAVTTLAPSAPAERVALARTMRLHGASSDALMEIGRAVAAGDSSGATLILYGELFGAAGRWREAEGVYRLAARDSAARSLALYRRARVLLRLGGADGPAALSTFADAYPSDTAAATALFLVGDALGDRGDPAGRARTYARLFSRYPIDPRSSQARFRLAAEALQRGLPDSAGKLFRAEVSAAASQRLAARYWLGKLADERKDHATARTIWVALAHEDSLGYYGLRARSAARLPPVHVEPAAPLPAAEGATLGLARIDTLLLAGLDSEAQFEVQYVVSHPPLDLESLLVWSQGLAARGWGPAAIRLGWQAGLHSPNDARVLRAIFPWPNRSAVEAEAREFKLDPLLLAAMVRQESSFDPEALSPAGARGLAQLLPGTAAFTARGLDMPFDTNWITVPDLNLHLGAAHLSELLRRFGGRVEAAVAAYNAGGLAVRNWLARRGADDRDTFIEAIPYQETRGYVRSVLRNRELYRALYQPPGD